MQSASDQWFDEAYYQRYYHDPHTRVVDAEQMRRLGEFVASYLAHLRLPVRRVLDMGCGIGLWRDTVAQRFPGASYLGVEYSEHLCQRYGWSRGSVVDWRADEPFDLVICQGVLAYLNPSDLRRALANLDRLCRGALYLEAVTLEDYERDAIDLELSDPRLYRHRAALYRRGLTPHFRAAGGGLWLSRRAPVPLLALEAPD